MNSYDQGLMWFRRDLRTQDNAALHHALKHCRRVWCVFVFDTDILDALPRADRRVEFIRESLMDLDAQLRALGAEHGTTDVGLIVRHGAAPTLLTPDGAGWSVQAGRLVGTPASGAPFALAGNDIAVSAASILKLDLAKMR